MNDVRQIQTRLPGMLLIALLGAALCSVSALAAETTLDREVATARELAASQDADGGLLTGVVTLSETGGPVHQAIIRVYGPELVATTDADGRYEIELPPGTYDVLVFREHLSSVATTVTIEAGATSRLDVVLSFEAVHEEITVTASGREITAFEAFSTVDTLDSLDIARDVAATIGEQLERRPGVAKRGFGPGNSRPIIRGFDGDRVLIMQDGVRTGDLSSQSGDHGVALDPASVGRIEVVKGPATLLYGSNAVGGVVNAVSQHQIYRSAPPKHLHGQMTLDGGTANGQLGGNANLQTGGERWMAWFGGGARRTSDYDTPEGTVENSATRSSNGRAGVGYFGDRAFASALVEFESGRFGVPFAAEFHGEHGHEEDHGEAVVEAEQDQGDDFEVDLDQERLSLRFDLGLRDLEGPVLRGASLAVSYLDYNHRELEVEGDRESVGTRFDNETWVVRLEAEQARLGGLDGRLGLWAKHRDYRATGEEALSPPTLHRAFAAFAYEELDLGAARLLVGGRLEVNDYDPERGPEVERLATALASATQGASLCVEPGCEEIPDARPRTFTGVSASAGIHVELTSDSALVANVSRSYRAPSLEELYNFGPHVGNLAFEIGNADLAREITHGFEVSLRHRSADVQAELSTYLYDIDAFVFPFFTGEERDDLREARFLQSDARFVGFDAHATVHLRRDLHLHASAGYVDAELTGTGESLPRIPPLHGTFGLDLRFGRLEIHPEIVWAASQKSVFVGETTTDGYARFDVGASYSLLGDELMHIFSLKVYNVGDQLYRNHGSFIKDLAPETGRGVKLSYAVRLF